MSKLINLTTPELRSHVKELEAKPERTTIEEAALFGFNCELLKRSSGIVEDRELANQPGFGNLGI